MVQNTCIRSGRNSSTRSGVIVEINFYTWPWDDLHTGILWSSLREYIVFASYYITYSNPIAILQAIQETEGPKIHHIEHHSDFDLDPSTFKPNWFICHLNYIINQSLVKFRPLVYKIPCKQDAHTDACMHWRTLQINAL